jgi:hypothetical protein
LRTIFDTTRLLHPTGDDLAVFSASPGAWLFNDQITFHRRQRRSAAVACHLNGDGVPASFELPLFDRRDSPNPRSAFSSAAGAIAPTASSVASMITIASPTDRSMLHRFGVRQVFVLQCYLLRSGRPRSAPPCRIFGAVVGKRIRD